MKQKYYYCSIFVGINFVRICTDILKKIFFFIEFFFQEDEMYKFSFYFPLHL